LQQGDLTAYDGRESWIEPRGELVEILGSRRTAQHAGKPVPDQVPKIEPSLRVNGYIGIKPPRGRTCGVDVTAIPGGDGIAEYLPVALV